MPSVSEAQAHLMAAVAHGWHKPGGGGPPVSVAKEFHAADKAKGTWEHYTRRKQSSDHQNGYGAK